MSVTNGRCGEKCDVTNIASKWLFNIANAETEEQCTSRQPTQVTQPARLECSQLYNRETQTRTTVRAFSNEKVLLE